MKAVILAGGLGTRISEETHLKPKPMIEIGGMPILWHIMKLYSYYGFNRFILALGYKSEYIKQYFYNYKNTGSDFSLRMDHGKSITYLNNSDEKDWEIVFVDTGLDTLNKIIIENKIEPKEKSGQQEKLENIINKYL